MALGANAMRWSVVSGMFGAVFDFGAGDEFECIELGEVILMLPQAIYS